MSLTLLNEREAFPREVTLLSLASMTGFMTLAVQPTARAHQRAYQVGDMVPGVESNEVQKIQ